jgi:hypothetical protein
MAWQRLGGHLFISPDDRPDFYSRQNLFGTDTHTIWIAGAHRDDGKRFVVHADEMVTAFCDLQHQVSKRVKR